MRVAEPAWAIVKANDSNLAEKVAADPVANKIKANAKLGMGLKIPKKRRGTSS